MTSDPITWTRSSYCSPHCVEVAQVGEEVLVRDSKNPTGGVLSFTPAEWTAFVKGAQAGEFNLN